MNQIQVVPTSGGIGGVISLLGPNLPQIMAGDTIFVMGMGLWTGMCVSMCFPTAQSKQKQMFIGQVNAAKSLSGTFTADENGSVAGLLVGEGFFMADGEPSNNIFGMQAFAYVPLVPQPPVPLPPPSINNLAQIVVGRAQSGAAPLVSNSDFCGGPGSPVPGIPLMYTSGGMTVSGNVGWGLALSDAASASLAREIGATVVKALPPSPDPTSCTFIGAKPMVNWLMLPSTPAQPSVPPQPARYCCAGFIGKTVAYENMDAPTLAAQIDGQFTATPPIFS